MSGSGNFPKFHNPPVDEVAVGIKFSTTNPSPFHYQPFRERVRAEFPNLQILPPITPLPEGVPANFLPMSPNAFQGFVGLGAWPRVLFISEDDCSLIQLQGDRLYFNWRKRPDKEYEKYEGIRDGFSKAYTALEAVIGEQQQSQLTVSSCEVLYVNPLPESVTGATPSFPDKVFRICATEMGNEWRVPIEDLSFTQRYPLFAPNGDQIGRLNANMSTVMRGNEKQMRLELTARGTPTGSGLDGALTFHNIGHEAIVRCFAAITTPEMHVRWNRYQ